MTRIVGVVQARMGSTRLPGKVLRRLGGTSVLGRVVRAVRESAGVDELVVATTTEPLDDAVVEECRQLAVEVYRGSVDDVLARFLGALAGRRADAVARFTADCPLLDPAVVMQVIRAFRTLSDVDYVSTSIAPRLPLGTNVEVVRVDALRRADALIRSDPSLAFHRTHVTSFVWAHPELFRVVGLTLPPDRSSLRVTLDTPEDWQLVSAVIEEFGDVSVPLADLVGWLDAHPAVRALNADVRQKAVEVG